MRRFFPFLLMLLALCGCARTEAQETCVLVSIVETSGCTVENNGQLVKPGEDVSFILRLDEDRSLASVNHCGRYHSEVRGDTVILTLENVCYPTRATLDLTCTFCEIEYDANGGDKTDAASARVCRNYDLTYHRRPNTERGTELFTREGYTLLCWNTRPDGTGEQISLGSRVTVGDAMTLYAQWVKWPEENCFQWVAVGDTVTITAYHGMDRILAIPAELGGRPVTKIAAGAFRDCATEHIILPDSLRQVEDGAFQCCALRELTLFDSIEQIGDSAFEGCVDLQTLHISAAEEPYGYNYRKESCYADKVDLLILTERGNRAVFYGGCSTWYNLDGAAVSNALGEDYTVVNMGLNGTVNSAVQMQIMGAYLRSGDIFIHTPELSSRQQLLDEVDMAQEDAHLWCGLENNYDLFAHVDLRTVGGVLNSLCSYLSMKKERADYGSRYIDSLGQDYMDPWGCIPFMRQSTAEQLADQVLLDPGLLTQEAMTRLGAYYSWYHAKGVRVYVSYACVNLDAVPVTQRGNVDTLDRLFRAAVKAMDGPILVSRLGDYLYHDNDFYDTNYHLKSDPMEENTARWLRDLLQQMEADGLRAVA